MAEKDIILRINAVTNQDVVEAYGETIDEALGTYEKWIKTTKDATAVIEGYNKKIKEGNTLTTEEIKSLNEEKAKRSEAQRLMRQEDKIRTSANGSLKQQQLLLSKVNDALRKLTDEQKKAHPELVKFQKALYDQVKGVNAEMGNFQMNVGNYPQLLQQILPVQGQMSNGLMQIAKSMGATTGALGVLGGALGVGAVAWAGFQQAMELTQTVGDAVAIKVGGWSAAWDKFVRMVVSWDFSNFIQNLKDAKQAGEELTAELDELFERNNALKIAQAEASIEQEKNLMIMRDQTKSLKERKEAGQAYIESVRELARVEQDIAQQEFDARLKNFAVQTGLSEEDVQFYIKNYNKYREVKEATSADEKRFIDISSKYNDANDEITSQLVDAWVRVSTAISNGEKSIQRAATTVSSLTAQEQRKGIKAGKQGVDIDASKVFTFKEDKTKVKIATQNLFSAFEEEIDKELAGVQTMRGGGTSPFAVALGVSDEELTTIKSQALSAAQSIYNSIQQLSQQSTQQRLKDELEAIDNQAESEKAILKSKLDRKLINQKQYEKKLAEVDKAAEKRREEANREAFEKNKAWNIGQALMNMALAITNIWATNKGGAAARIAETVIATASGLAQIATISAQKYARGGELHGASHAQGGIKGNIQGHNIELEGGEIVINKRSSAKYRKALSLINSENGWGVDFANTRGRGYRFARGGVLGSYDFSPAPVPKPESITKAIEVSNQRTEAMIAATNRRIDRLQVQVNISDIESASETKQVHINRASL
ncbi:MAG: hypothetical protein IIV72_08235 [Alistipes sp.]|nr:hypothetical protein [Alistipes sp.]